MNSKHSGRASPSTRPRSKLNKEGQSKSRRRPSPRSSTTEDISHYHPVEDDYLVRKYDEHRESKRRRKSEDAEECRPTSPRPSSNHKSGRSRPSPRRRHTSRERFAKCAEDKLYSEEDKGKHRSRPKHSSDEEVDEPHRSNHSPVSRRHSSEEGEQKSNEIPTEHKRYWGRGDSDLHSVNRSRPSSSPRPKDSDRYWSKYPVNDKVEPGGSRYYGNYSSRSMPRSFSDQENLKRKLQDNDKSTYHRGNKQKSSRETEDDATTPSVESSVKAQTVVAPPAPRQKKNLDMLTTKTGGAYIPPARLRMMQAQMTDKSSAEYQRLSWEALKKSIHGYINKVNTANIAIIVRELLKENVVRGRGLLCRSIIQAQAASPTFTHVYASLVSVINSKFPNIGELLLRRLIIQFKRGFKRNDKNICISAASFVAHLVNQRVAHEILALEILTLLVESPTDDSVEVAIAFLKECGMKLMEVSNKGIHAIFELLRNILHEGHLDKRVQYMIEVMFQVRKDNFRDHEAIQKELDLVEEEDQFTHLLTLENVKDPEDILNVFKLDPEYEESEAKYKALKHELLDEDSNESGSDSGSEGGSEEESENEDDNKESTIIDNTETNLIALRRTIYLTIHSSLDFEECAHKLMRMQLKPGQEIELCHMFLDCCAEQRTYEKFYGLLSQRFCQINKIFIPPFQQIFRNTYDTIHRLDTNKLRNVAKFFAHLLFTDAISWEVLSLIRLNEEETTSSSRIFIKILFQELSEYMGLTKLNERVKDGTLQAAFDGLFPRDDPKNTRFAINFFTSIGLGGLTDELREHLKSQPKVSVVPKLAETLQVSSDSSSSDSSSSGSSSDSSSDSSSSSSSESEDSSGNHRRSKKLRKDEKGRKTRNKKSDSNSQQKKKSNVGSPPKHRKKKSSR